MTTTKQDAEEFIFRAAVAGLCGYETAAITTGKVPTLSSLMWRTPMVPRAAIWAGAAIVLTDHFITRRWS
jgi:hypothetical protein